MKPGITDAIEAVEARQDAVRELRSELAALIAACEKFGREAPYEPALLDLSLAVQHAKQVLAP